MRLAQGQVRPLWQIVPTAMGDMLKDKDKKKLARVTEAFLKMKKEGRNIDAKNHTPFMV